MISKWTISWISRSYLLFQNALEWIFHRKSKILDFNNYFAHYLLCLTSVEIVKDEETLKYLISYLYSLSDSPEPFLSRCGHESDTVLLMIKCDRVRGTISDRVRITVFELNGIIDRSKRIKIRKRVNTHHYDSHDGTWLDENFWRKQRMRNSYHLT